eukprot:tig00000042_g15470.t2
MKAGARFRSCSLPSARVPDLPDPQSSASAPRSKLGARICIAESVASVASSKYGMKRAQDLAQLRSYVVPVDSALSVLDKDYKTLQNYAALMTYLVFYVIYILVLFMQRDTQQAYNIRSGITSDLARTGYDSVHDGPSFYAWAKAGLLDYTNRDGNAFISRMNRIIGGVVILNYRVGLEDCGGQPRFKLFYPACTAHDVAASSIDVSSATAEQQARLVPLARGLLGLNASVPDSDVFATFSSLVNSGTFPHPLGLDYDKTFGANVVAVLPEVHSKEQAETFLSIGEVMGAVGGATRAVAVRVTTYNGHARSLAFTELLFTFTTGGRVRTKVASEIIRVELYSLTADKVRLALEIFVFAYVLYWLAQWVYRAARAHRRRRLGEEFSSLVALVDLVDLLLFLVVIVMWISIAYSIQTEVPTLKFAYTFGGESFAEDLNTVVTLFNLSQVYAYRTKVYSLLTAINLFLGMTRLLRLLHFQGRMSILTRTLVRAASDLSHFALLFAVVLVSYACMGQVLYGHAVQDYSDAGSALTSLAKIMVSAREDYDQINEIDVISTVLFFWTFVILIAYILVNMFLAIIIDTYGDVRDEAAASSESLLAELVTVSRIHFREVVVRSGRLLSAGRWRPPVISDRQVRAVLKELRAGAEDGVVSGPAFVEALRARHPHLDDSFLYYCLERVGRSLDDDSFCPDEQSGAGSRRESLAPSGAESSSGAVAIAEGKPPPVPRFASASTAGRVRAGAASGATGSLAPRKSVRKRLELHDAVKQLQNGNRDPAQLSAKQRIKELVASQRLAQERLARMEEALAGIGEALERIPAPRWAEGEGEGEGEGGRSGAAWAAPGAS